jgi:hypothetical protein
MFRRSGSAVTWFIPGKMPNPRSPAFAEALARQRFRSVENAASEEVSIGWVTPGDPTGDSFELADMDLDVGIWMRVRFDRKKLPSAWVAIYRAQAEKSTGRRLSLRERRDLKQDLMEKLLPRVLPTVRLVDVLYEPRQRLLMLFGTARAVREEFHKLFFRTFAVNLVECEPYVLATHVGLDRETAARLEQVSPVPWPSQGPGTRRPRAIAGGEATTAAAAGEGPTESA